MRVARERATLEGYGRAMDLFESIEEDDGRATNRGEEITKVGRKRADDEASLASVDITVARINRSLSISFRSRWGSPQT